MKNNKGFISISVVYSFFLVFIAIIMSIVVAYTSRRLILNEIKSDVRDSIKNSDKSLAKHILSNYGGESNIEVLDNSYFNNNSTDSDTGLYKAQDDYGTSYYFRGDVDNNYVQFGSYAAGTVMTVYDYLRYTDKEITFEEDTPMYWRVVRINGDGTIRLVYDGTEKIENGNAKSTAEIGGGEYNVNDGNAKYVGYTYDDGTGVQVDSTIKSYLDDWYESYLKKYETYIADSVFCNDKEIKDYKYTDEFYEPTTQENAKYTNFLYGSLVRFNTKTPSLECTRKEDRYTMDDTIIGNGYLKYPIGTIAMDEVLMSGLVNNYVYDSPRNYLHTGNIYWTMSPADTNVSFYVDVFISSLRNDATGMYVSWSEIGYRPVINLKADVSFIGTGEINDPYIIGG